MIMREHVVRVYRLFRGREPPPEATNQLHPLLPVAETLVFGDH
jgi:hypothetical protein